MGNDPAPKSLTTSQQIATTLAPSRGRDQEITKTAHHPKPVDHAQTERDVAALVTEFFAAVSFEPGSGPHYEAIRTLFIDEGILVKNIADIHDVSNVDGFIRPRQALVESGQTHRVVRR